MLITPGPLLIVPAESPQAYWLKNPAQRSGTAIATIWHTKAPDEAPGNAIVMAYASELYTLAHMLSTATSTEDALTAKRVAKDLVARMAEAADPGVLR